MLPFFLYFKLELWPIAVAVPSPPALTAMELAVVQEVRALPWDGDFMSHHAANCALKSVRFCSTAPEPWVSGGPALRDLTPGGAICAGGGYYDLTDMDFIDVLPWQYTEDKGPSGVWDGTTMNWSWRLYLGSLWPETYSKHFGDCGIVKFAVRAIPGSRSPWPPFESEEHWEFQVTLSDGSVVGYHPPGKGGTVRSTRATDEERLAAFSQVRKKGISEKTRAMYPDTSAPRVHPQGPTHLSYQPVEPQMLRGGLAVVDAALAASTPPSDPVVQNFVDLRMQLNQCAAVPIEGGQAAVADAPQVMLPPPLPAGPPPPLARPKAKTVKAPPPKFLLMRSHPITPNGPPGPPPPPQPPAPPPIKIMAVPPPPPGPRPAVSGPQPPGPPPPPSRPCPQIVAQGISSGSTSGSSWDPPPVLHPPRGLFSTGPMPAQSLPSGPPGLEKQQALFQRVIATVSQRRDDLNAQAWSEEEKTMAEFLDSLD